MTAKADVPSRGSAPLSRDPGGWPLCRRKMELLGSRLQPPHLSERRQELGLRWNYMRGPHLLPEGLGAEEERMGFGTVPTAVQAVPLLLVHSFPLHTQEARGNEDSRGKVRAAGRANVQGC